MRTLLTLLGVASAAAVDCNAIPPDPPITAAAWPAAGRADGAWLGDSAASLQGWDVYQK